jgi:hypothetical protein
MFASIATNIEVKSIALPSFVGYNLFQAVKLERKNTYYD